MADTPRKNWFGRALDAVAETETNPLALAWRALPPNVRAAYASLPTAIGELSPGAAVRDTVQASGETAKAAMQGRGWDAAGGVANMLAAAAGVVPGSKLLVKGAKAANPIRAYHGSPHDFDRFDMSKIGTGEGAQAYGHGLYFAENPKIAQAYQDTLSHPTRNFPGEQTALPYIGGELFEPRNYEVMKIAQSSRDPEVVKSSLQDYIKRNGADNPFSYNEDAKRIIDAIDAKQYSTGLAGRMYEVNIHADPAKFLDWDKPISAQPLALDIARSVGVSPNESGQQLIRSASTSSRFTGGSGPLTPTVLARGAENASNALREAGIPGIKYLDGGSRAAGDGSRNYVAFDDKLIEILRKYGLLPVAAGGAAVAANPLSTGESEAY